MIVKDLIDLLTSCDMKAEVVILTSFRAKRFLETPPEHDEAIMCTVANDSELEEICSLQEITISKNEDKN